MPNPDFNFLAEGIEEMETEFLKKKWQTVFNAADVNKDGVITMDDADLFAERFAAHHKLSDKRAQQLRSNFHDTWRDLLLYGRDVMEPEDFIKVMSEEYSRDRNAFTKRMHDIQQSLVEIFDVNSDGKISEEEFVVVLKCWGIVELDHKFVEKFPQSPVGYIPKDAWRDAWVTFFCNCDEANIKEERPVLESFGLI